MLRESVLKTSGGVAGYFEPAATEGDPADLKGPLSRQKEDDIDASLLDGLGESPFFVLKGGEGRHASPLPLGSRMGCTCAGEARVAGKGGEEV